MPNLELRIALQNDGLPTPNELEFRHFIQDMIERTKIGRVTGGGGGLGEMDISIHVADTALAKVNLQNLVEELGISERTYIDEYPE